MGTSTKDKMSMTLFLLVSIFFVNYSVAGERVKVSLYYEGLCPYCHAFIVDQLYPGFQKLGSSLQLDLVPLGNAWHTTKAGRIEWTCQHGPLECYINKISACGIFLSATQSKFMEFIYCLIKDSKSSNSPDTQKAIAVKCAKENNISWDKMKICMDSNADKLELAYEDRQKKLIPEFSYVPHIRFDDKFNATLEDAARNDFVATACLLFNIKPKVCFKTRDAILSDSKKIEPKKCYFNEISEMYNDFIEIV